MSSYFDKTDQEITECQDSREGHDRIRQIEDTLVRDVTVCAMFPDFPADLRNLIHLTVLQYAVHNLPETAYPADFETFDEHKQRMHRLSCDLHTLFHDAAHRGLTDSPLTPLRQLYSEGECQREELILAMPAWKCQDEACGRTWGFDPRPVMWPGANKKDPTCPRCLGPSTQIEGKTFGQIREESGYNTPCWECTSCEKGKWACKTPNLPCPACGTPGVRSGFSLGQAKGSQLDYPLREEPPAPEPEPVVSTTVPPEYSLYDEAVKAGLVGSTCEVYTPGGDLIPPKTGWIRYVRTVIPSTPTLTMGGLPIPLLATKDPTVWVANSRQLHHVGQSVALSCPGFIGFDELLPYRLGPVTMIQY